LPGVLRCEEQFRAPEVADCLPVTVERALPDGHLIVRRGLGHTKKLDAKVVAATLTADAPEERRP
jgi:hypothetical protein